MGQKRASQLNRKHHTRIRVRSIWRACVYVCGFLEVGREFAYVVEQKFGGVGLAQKIWAFLFLW